MKIPSVLRAIWRQKRTKMRKNTGFSQTSRTPGEARQGSKMTRSRLHESRATFAQTVSRRKGWRFHQNMQTSPVVYNLDRPKTLGGKD